MRERDNSPWWIYSSGTHDPDKDTHIYLFEMYTVEVWRIIE